MHWSVTNINAIDKNEFTEQVLLYPTPLNAANMFVICFVAASGTCSIKCSATKQDRCIICVT